MRHAFLTGLIFALACFAEPSFAAGYSDWGAIIVAGDYRAHDGGDSQVFDDARNDIGDELQHIGFQHNNIEEFSVRPQLYSPAPLQSDPQTIGNGLWDVSNRTNGGCFVYFTSHGSPDGVVVGDTMISPNTMATMVSNSCGSRPTVVVISACFSGVFVPVLQENNRMILTAARPDRSSFGCSESDKYPYFDTCVLKVLPSSHDFAAFGPAVQACVAQRETETGMHPASEPQFWVGPNLRPMLPLFAFPTG
jgi:hypothetical protein